MSSKHGAIIKLLRKLLLSLLHFNIDLRSVHVPGDTNILCDAISRLQVTSKQLEEYGMRKEKTPIPSYLHPDNYELGQVCG